MSIEIGTLEHVKTVLEDKKACSVKVIDVREKTSLADYFVICHATSAAHSKTLADALVKESKNSGVSLISADTGGDGEWKVLDYGDVIVHLFLEEAREYYDLDSVWMSADPVEALAKRADLRRERQPIDVRSVFARASGGTRRRKFR